jgi:hypothetical protein
MGMASRVLSYIRGQKRENHFGPPDGARSVVEIALTQKILPRYSPRHPGYFP